MRISSGLDFTQTGLGYSACDISVGRLNPTDRGLVGPQFALASALGIGHDSGLLGDGGKNRPA